MGKILHIGRLQCNENCVQRIVCNENCVQTGAHTEDKMHGLSMHWKRHTTLAHATMPRHPQLGHCGCNVWAYVSTKWTSRLQVAMVLLVNSFANLIVFFSFWSLNSKFGIWCLRMSWVANNVVAFIYVPKRVLIIRWNRAGSVQCKPYQVLWFKVALIEVCCNCANHLL